MYTIFLNMTLLISGMAFAFGLFLYKSLIKHAAKKNKVTRLASLASDGLFTLSKRLFSSIFQIIIYTTLVFLLFSQVFKKPFYWTQIFAFLLGGGLMCFSTFFCLRFMPQTIARIIDKSTAFLHDLLLVQYKASSAIALILISSILFGFTLCISLLPISAVIGYCLGVTLASFFLRVGVGLFKSGAAISENILPFTDKKIPAFDERNLSTLLGISANYAGKIIGFSADIISSFMIALTSCLLFSRVLLEKGLCDTISADKLMIIPIVTIAISLVTTLIIFILSPLKIKSKHKSNFLLEGLYLALFSCGLTLYTLIRYLDVQVAFPSLWGTAQHHAIFLPYLFGLIGAVLISFTSEYLTSNKYPPIKKLSSEIEFGSVLTTLNTFTLGLQSNSFYFIYILLMSIPSFYISGFYGIAMASLGMLSVTPCILTLHIFSPISSTTEKLVKLSKSKQGTLKTISKSEVIGQTTVAIGNGFASGASAFSTLSLILITLLITQSKFNTLLLIDLKWVIGLMIGLMLPFVFSGFLLRKLSQLIVASIQETVRQFKEIPFLKENKAHPDIIKATDEHARFCMDALIIPSIIMAFTPILVGYLFGLKLLIGLIFGAFLTGLNQSYYWANLGESSENAKRYIEKGFLGGKNSANFKEILTTSNIGSAFKDLLSPSLNIFIKSVAIIGLLVIIFLNQHLF